MQASEPSSKGSAFISYRRRDGEAYAKRLRLRLQNEAPEVCLWRDREDMVGGISWWEQIKEAIDNVPVVILVLTPGALEPDSVVISEWKYARQEGKHVFPVLVPEHP